MKVLVTGAAGYLGGHCVKDLLEHGHQVRGTVRDLGDDAKIGYLRDLGPVDLVEADLGADAGWAEAAAGCDVVLHTASPFFLDGDDASLTRPAVDGTLRVLRSASAAGVKRVVLTSSTAAIVNSDPAEDGSYSEAQWSDPDRCSPYPKSKTLAERAAWEFVETQPEPERLELVVCNPCLILGPLLSDRTSLSLDVVRRILARQMPAVPRIGFSVVDVRDVAAAHRLAAETPGAAGERYLLASEFMWMLDMAKALKDGLGSRGYRPPTSTLPYPLLWLASRFDTSLKSVLPDVGKRRDLVNDKARRDLGWTPRSARESVIATGESLADRGLV